MQGRAARTPGRSSRGSRGRWCDRDGVPRTAKDQILRPLQRGKFKRCGRQHVRGREYEPWSAWLSPFDASSAIISAQTRLSICEARF